MAMPDPRRTRMPAPMFLQQPRAAGLPPAAASGRQSEVRPTRPAAPGAANRGQATQAPPAAQKLPAGAQEGFYVGSGLERSNMGHRDYYFTADGWVINNIPLVNMDNFDMTAYRNDPSNKLFIG